MHILTIMYVISNSHARTYVLFHPYLCVFTDRRLQDFSQDTAVPVGTGAARQTNNEIARQPDLPVRTDGQQPLSVRLSPSCRTYQKAS